MKNSARRGAKKTASKVARTTARAKNRGTARPSDRATVPFSLAVHETLLAKLRLASPSGDSAAAALSFLLERFK